MLEPVPKVIPIYVRHLPCLHCVEALPFEMGCDISHGTRCDWTASPSRNPPIYLCSPGGGARQLEAGCEPPDPIAGAVCLRVRCELMGFTLTEIGHVPDAAGEGYSTGREAPHFAIC